MTVEQWVKEFMNVYINDVKGATIVSYDETMAFERCIVQPPETFRRHLHLRRSRSQRS